MQLISIVLTSLCPNKIKQKDQLFVDRLYMYFKSPFFSNKNPVLLIQFSLNFVPTGLIDNNISTDLGTRPPHWVLTRLPLDKMAIISQTTFSSAFSWMTNFVFWFKFNWSLFPIFQLTIRQHWFRQWRGAAQATSHYLNQCSSASMTQRYGVLGGRWVLIVSTGVPLTNMDEL